MASTLYGKNKNCDVDSMINTFKSKYHSTMNSMSTSASSNASFSNSNSKQCPILKQCIDYTNTLKNEHTEHIEELNRRMINNINVLNIRYIDTGSNNYFLCCRQRFKKVTDYNRRAQSFYKMDLKPNVGCWAIGTTKKVMEYRRDFNKHL